MLSRYKKRSETGALGVLIQSALLLAFVGIAALAVDIYHLVAVKAELQNATDAGALAGAQALWTDIKTANADAYTLTGMNAADGRTVKNSSPGTTVAVTVVPPAPGVYGTVEVDASMAIQHLFAPIFGRPFDTVSVRSVAGTKGILRQVFSGQTFPIAVSWTAQPANGIPLSQAKMGDTFSLNINSQQVKNAAFTSLTAGPANANWIQSAFEQLLGLAPQQPGFIPSTKIGDSINLTNGVAEQKKLAKSPELPALIDPNRAPLILPIVMDGPPMNQSQPIIGYIGFKVTGVTLNNGSVESLVGILSRPQVDGSSGSVDPSTPGALSSMSPGPVQLIE